MYPHRIRLRGPWQAEPLDPPGPPRQVTLPATLAACGLGDARRLRFRRRFGRPRRLDDFERLWLIGEGLGGRATLHVNGREVGGAAGTFAFPVTDLIAERNELVIDLESDGPDEGLSGDVALEVRCAAYLSAVRATRANGGQLLVEGIVAGEEGGTLEVYVLADGRTIGYKMCQAGRPFAIVTDQCASGSADVRVELVNGSVIWFVVEFQLCESPERERR